MLSLSFNKDPMLLPVLDTTSPSAASVHIIQSCHPFPIYKYLCLFNNNTIIIYVYITCRLAVT